MTKSNGDLIMGAGLALQAAKLYPELPGAIGRWVNRVGNKPGIFELENRSIISFPTKEDYKDDSTVERVQRSINELIELLQFHKPMTIAFPKVGCGLGGLDYANVKQLLFQFESLKHNFIIPR